MRFLFSLLATVAVLFVSFVVYIFTCWLIGDKTDLTGYTFVLTVNLMWQFYYETLKRRYE